MKRKLSLRRETLRLLAGHALRHVNGGAINTAAGTDCSVQTVDAYTCQGTCNDTCLRTCAASCHTCHVTCEVTP